MALDFSQYGDPVEKPDFSSLGTPANPADVQGDTAKGFKRAFAQVPELAYGVGALSAMTAENLFGEGGISTTVKNYFAEKFAKKQAENQKYAPSVEFTDAWENLKKGDVGSMVDWLQDSAGYVVGQGIQTLATGAAGAIAGKAVLSGATEKMLGGVVAKQAAKIAEENAVRQGLTGTAKEAAIKAALPEATKLAAQRTAQVIGAGVVLNAQNLGMEAGDIYGGLMEESAKNGKPVTGDDLLRAWGAAAAAAGTETATDLLGLGAVTGRIKIGGKSVQAMLGAKGKLVRGAMAAGVATPLEGTQEYVQTGLEQYGAGKPLNTEEARHERINAAAVGALGGTLVGGGAGLISKERADADAIGRVMEAPTVDAAIAAATAATEAPQTPQYPAAPDVPMPLSPDLPELTGGPRTQEQRLWMTGMEAKEQKQKSIDLDRLQRESKLPAALYDAEQKDAMARASGELDVAGAPNAMQLALQRAQDEAGKPKFPPAPAVPRPNQPEWANFPSDSGTLGIPRKDMPQVKAEHRGALVNFLKARDVESQHETVPAESLKPSQAEFSPAKVRQALEYKGGDRSILISSDNHIVDGHHQWLAKARDNQPIQVIRLNAPIKDLLPLVKEFPSSGDEQSFARESWQWKRNAQGNQTFGNRQRIEPITRALFEQYVQPRVGKTLKDFEAWRAANPEATHISLFEREDGTTVPGKPFVGKLADLRPQSEATEKGWAKQVQSFEDPETLKFGASADQDADIMGRPASEFTDAELQEAAKHGGGRLRKVIQQELAARKRATASAPKPVTLMGKTVDKLSDQALEFAAKTGSPSVKEIAQAELDRRRNEKTGGAFTALQDENLRATLAGMRQGIGHDERGGMLIIDETTRDSVPGFGDVLGKTKFTGAPWWFARPDPDLLSGPAKAAIDKALAGERLGEREQRFIDYLLEIARQNEVDMLEAQREAEAQPEYDDLTDAGQAALEALIADGIKVLGDERVNLLRDWVKSNSTDEAQYGELLKDALETEIAAAADRGQGEATAESGAGQGADRGQPDTRGPPESAAPVDETPAAPEPQTPSNEGVSTFGAGNKVFTQSAADKARETLRKKLGNVNSGIDPETMQAGLQLAGYYIEGGARSFADYSKKMVADLGEAVRPYLKSWYLAVRNYPGFNNVGMQSEAEINGLPDDDTPYNARVRNQERYAEVQRLQSDATVLQRNGKPFKTRESALQFQQKFDLTDTHEVRPEGDGFKLAILGAANRPSALKAEADRRANDPETQRQEAAFARAEKIGEAANAAVTRYENGESSIEEFEAALDAADGASKGTAPEHQAAAGAESKPSIGGSFDSEKFNAERDQRIKESREAGNKHLDDFDASVEGMRGLEIYYVHDPKVRGTVRTVANTGEVVINWKDDYSGEKEMATKRKDGKREVWQSWLMPSDLKDYVVDKKRPALELTGETPADLTAKAQREAAQAMADAAKALKETADQMRDSFTLTGSARPADEAAARGQGDLLSAGSAALGSGIERVEDGRPILKERVRAEFVSAIEELRNYSMNIGAGVEFRSEGRGYSERLIGYTSGNYAGVMSYPLYENGNFLGIGPFTFAEIKRKIAELATVKPEPRPITGDQKRMAKFAEQESVRAKLEDQVKSVREAGHTRLADALDRMLSRIGSGVGPSLVRATLDRMPRLIEQAKKDPEKYFNLIPAKGITPAQKSRMEKAAAAAKDREEREARKLARAERMASKAKPAVTPKPAAQNPGLTGAEAAQADLDAALGDLGDIFGKGNRLLILPEQEQRLMPVLVRVFDAAFRLGYYKFRAAASFVMDTIREKFGAEAADMITLDHLQGAYIAMAGKYQDQGADNKRDVVSVETLADLAEPADGVVSRFPGIEGTEFFVAKLKDGYSVGMRDTDIGQNLPTLRIFKGPDALEKATAFAQEAADDAAAKSAPTVAPESRTEDDVNGEDWENFDAPNTSTNLEPNRRARPPENTGGQPSLFDEPGRNDGPADRASRLTGEARVSRSGDPVVSADGAVADGERSDQPVHRENGEFRAPDRTAGSADSGGGADLFSTGLGTLTTRGGPAPKPASGAVSLETKRLKQRAAQSVPVITGDADNIAESLPFLMDGQRDDVKFAEDRFAQPDGHGVLFTNGTGTGKTFTGLGVAKRFERAGKDNILIVVPNDNVANAWIEAGRELVLDIKLLDSMESNGGIGPIVTTYANFGANPTLVNRQWDLIIPDEAHYLSSNADGDTTNALAQLRALTAHPDGYYPWFKFMERELFAEMDGYRQRGKAIPDALMAQYNAADAARRAEYKARNRENHKALFLSATPFAYDKNVDWAEGYLFDYDRTDQGGGYNVASGRELFFVQHFGYRMRYNKLMQPGPEVDRGLMEIEFNGWLKKQGALSSRILDVDKDYERKFVLVDGGIGNSIDDGMQWLSEAEDGRFRPLADRIRKQFDFFARAFLLEAIKANDAVPMIEKHLALGHKVVVFHDYNKGGGRNPFRLMETGEIVTAGKYPNQYQIPLTDLIREFESKRPDLLDLDFNLPSPLQTMARHFKDALFINGTVPKKQRLEARNLFQNDKSGRNLIVVQSDAGREGVSLHDTTGKHQRVLINLGMPVKPTAAIQIEGRIYRIGQMSDALFLYMNTGTNFERYTFASKISERASSAENLALGAEARALKESFIDAFEESAAHEPADGMGKGGKEKDKASRREVGEFEKAKTHYFAQQKKTSRNKAKEGIDYFPTPEPLALKMVQWADIQSGDDLLEPSAGHGAIARYFPKLNRAKMVEPSETLGTRAMLVSGAELIQSRFEDYDTINKFDAIVMNPPFGSGGRTAIDHIDKAAKHLRDGGRIVALIPTGPAADAKFEKWFYEETTKAAKPLYTHPLLGPIYEGDSVVVSGFGAESVIAGPLSIDGTGDGPRYVRPKGSPKESAINLTAVSEIRPGKRTETYKPAANLYLVADIKLPRVTFERAGTAVAARVVVIEKQEDDERAKRVHQVNRDYSDSETIGEFFDAIEYGTVPDRQEIPAPEETETPDAALSSGRNGKLPATESAGTTYKKTEKTAKSGQTWHLAVPEQRIGDGWKDLVEKVREAGGWYARMWKGFAFETADMRDAFIESQGAPKAEQAGPDYLANPENRAENPSRGQDDYTQDLFGNPVPAPERADPVSAAPTESRDMDAATGVSGKNEPPAAVVVSPMQRGTLRVGFDKITTPKQAAHAFAAMRKQPREVFQILVTDGDGKPLAAYDIGLGTITQTSVYPREVITAAYMTPGAKKLWMAHNHPSGILQPSRADEHLTTVLRQGLTKDLGVEYAGHVIIAGDQAISIVEADSDMSGAQFRIPAASRKFEIPIMERRVMRQKITEAPLTSPGAVRDYLTKLSPKESGIIMLSSQYAPIGWIPMTPMSMSKLRNGGSDSEGAKLFRAVGGANFQTAIAYFPDIKNESSRAVENLGSALSFVDVKLLDAFVRHSGGELRSYAEIGNPLTSPSGTFFSRNAMPDRLIMRRRKDGLPVFGNKDIAMVRPKHFSNDEGLLVYDLFDTRYVEAGVSEAKSKVGLVELEVTPDGAIKGLSSLFIRNDLQAPKRIREAMNDMGYGEKVIRAILATLPDGQRLQIYDILPSARGFWEKMGTTFEQGRIIENGFITRQSYEKIRGTIPSGDPGLVFSRRDGTENPADERATAGGRGRPETAETVDPLAFLRNPADAGFSVSGLTMRDAQAVYDRIAPTFTNLPPVTLLNRPGELPDRVKELRDEIHRAGAWSDVEGAFHDGEIFIFTDNIADEARLEHVLFEHEVRHYGLRGAFGKELDGILNGLMMRNPALRERALALRERLGLDSNVTAAEEVLADIPVDELVQLSGIDRFIAFIRDWLAKHNFTRLAARMDAMLVDRVGEQVAADALVADVIMAARDFARNGKPEKADLYMRGTRFADTEDGRTPPIWYSAFERFVDAKAPNSATAEQWGNTLDAWAKQGKFKADELEWSGVREWLQLQSQLGGSSFENDLASDGRMLSKSEKERLAKNPGMSGKKITKDQLLQFIRENGVKVEESMLGGPASNTGRRDQLVVELDALGYSPITDHEGVMLGLERRSDRREFWYDEDAAEFIDDTNDEVLPQDIAVKGRELGAMYDNAANEYPSEDSTKYGRYTLPGGKNYRELLLTLPTDATRLMAEGDRISRLERPTVAEIETFLRSNRAGSSVFQSSHWSQPNILAHIRFNERTDAEGKRVLFIEEIQSDWAQKGRKAGFNFPEASNELLMSLLNEAGYEANYNGVNWVVSSKDKSPVPNKLAGGEAKNQFAGNLAQVTQMVLGRTDLRPAHGAVPPAPFVQKTEAWTALALKRMIRYAAENGFDRVAFVTGQQSADRYDLSKQVGMILWRRLPEGDYALRLNGPRGGDIRGMEGTIRKTAQELPDFIGKALAEKITGAKESSGQLTGLDLKVGGEGMRTYYDKIVPNVANDLLKKLGGGRIINVPVSELGYGRSDFKPVQLGNLKWALRDEKGGEPIGIERNRFDTKQDAVAALSDWAPAAIAQPGFDITPELRATAMRGLPMFSRTDQTSTPEFRRWFGDSKVVDADGKPLVVYHGTGADFNKFRRRVGDIGMHFGTAGQADDRMEYLAQRPGAVPDKNAQVMPVYLRIRNPLRLKDAGSWNAENLKSALLDLFPGDSDRIGSRWGKDGLRSTKDIREFIQSKGYDGVVYKNTGEVEGSEPYREAVVKAKYALDERFGVGKNSFDKNDQETPEYEAWSLANGAYADFREEAGRDSYIAFDPTQIKSAVGNRGTFDQKNPDIRFSRATAKPSERDRITDKAFNFVNDLIQSDRRFNLWHRTVGTQQHKALINPEFKRVYDESQRFLSDISLYANSAANMAQDLMPRIEGFKDFFKKSPSQADINAAGNALMQGTLFGGGSPLNGRIWTDEELKTGRLNGKDLPLFEPLTEAQIKLYRQALTAVNHSLDEFAKSMVYRYAKPYGIFFDRGMGLADVVAEVNGVLDDEISNRRLEIESLEDQLTEAKREADAEYDREDADARNAHFAAVRRRTDLQRKIDRIEKEIAGFQETRNLIADVEQKTLDLQKHGYFPAMRFGQYAVYVVNKDPVTGETEQVHFSLHDTQREANAEARLQAERHPKAEVTKGVVSQERHRLFQGLSLDALETFAEHMNIDADPIVQGFLRAATSQRSTLKRQIHRKGLAGFTDDIPRALASFVVSTARTTSSNYHTANMLSAAQDIKAGDVQDEAVKLVRYLLDPVEEAAALRGFLFFNFIGGSIAHGIVNMTQPLMVTAPWLSQHTSYADAVSQLAKAMKEISGGAPLPKGVAEAVEQAKAEGVVAPQEIHQLRAEAGPSIAGKNLLMRKLTHVWGSIYSVTEQFNRESTFIAAYRIGVANKVRNPYQFAVDAVNETQFVYNKASRPNWARGPVGATVMTFKQFSISYLELMKRMHKKDKKAFAIMVLTLIAAAGLEGLPFAEDLEDLIDTVGQWMGFATNSKKALRNFATDILGKEVANFALHGVSAGLPVDVSVRLGLQNLVPGTAMLNPSAKNKAGDVVEILGPAGQFVPVEGTTLGRAIERLTKGDVFGAAKAGSPVAIKNFLTGTEMLETGEARDTTGKKIVDVTEGDAVAKMIGLQPARVAESSRRIEEVGADIAIQRAKEMEIADKWARGTHEKDLAVVREAMQELRDWNENNPELRIRITPTQINQRVKQMKLERDARFVKQAPPEIRREVRERLQQP